MPRVCELCGKGPRTGRTITRRGMAKRLGGVGRKIVRTSKRRFLPNLKKITAIMNGSKRRITICVECLKSGKVTRDV